MVLLTGATGFLGTHLLIELKKRNKKIRAFIRDKKKISRIENLCKIYGLNPQEILTDIEWFVGDIKNSDDIARSLENITEVYHTAAKVSLVSDNKEKFWQLNVKATENLVNFSLEKGIKKFCYISSIAALGENPAGLINEETYLNPEEKTSLYSKTKYYGEIEVWRGINEGLNAVIVNPAYILGADGNCEGNGCLFFNLINRGMSFYTDGIVGFVDVRDVAFLMVELMENNIFSERFILVSQNLYYKQILEWTAEALGKKMNFKRLTRFSVNIFYKFIKFLSWTNILKIPMGRTVVDNLFLNTRYSNAKILHTFSEFKFRDIKETIFELGEYYKNFSRESRGV